MNDPTKQGTEPVEPSGETTADDSVNETATDPLVSDARRPHETEEIDRDMGSDEPERATPEGG